MAKQSDFQMQMDRLNESTNQMAAMLTSLKDQIAGAGMQQEVEDSILAQLTKAADTLGAMANPKAEEAEEAKEKEESGEGESATDEGAQERSQAIQEQRAQEAKESATEQSVQVDESSSDETAPTKSSKRSK